MIFFRRATMLAAGAVFCCVASAAPAPWFKWISKHHGTQVCAQGTLGSGWERGEGPYKDARCTIPGKPGQ